MLHRVQSRFPHALFVCLVAAYPLVSPAKSDGATNFDIPAGDAATSLQTFARQSGFQILYPSREVEGRVAPAIQGRRDEIAVARTLAAAAGLRVIASQDRTITLAAASPRGTATGGAEAAVPAPAPATETTEILTLEEVVVTAEKAESTLQKTPVAITVLQGADLQGQARNTMEEALRLVPGVNIRLAQNATNSIITIRGIQPAANTDPTVNVNVDGVYQSNAGSAPQFDLSRIEVLKGPQGTLYGRNATGGVVNIITADPEENFGGSGFLGIGNYHARRVEGVLNTPFGSGLSMRTAVLYSKRDGYLSNGANDQDITAARVKLLLKPSDRISVLLAGEGDRTRGVGQGTVPADATAPVDDRSDPWYTPDPAGGYQADRWSLYGVLNWDLGFGVLTVQPGFYRLKALTDNELTGPDQGLVFGGVRSSQETYEVRLAQPSDSRFKWQAGYYYLSQKSTSFLDTPLVDVPIRSTSAAGLFQPFLTTAQALATPGIAYRRPIGGAGVSEPIAKNDAWAVFGQTTVPVTEALRLTAGVRYTKDEKSRQNRSFNGLGVESSPYGTPVVTNNATTPCVAGGPSSACYAEAQFHATTWKGGAEFDLTPTSLLYVDVAKGFKSGGLNILPVPSGYDLGYQPEEVLAYEAGSKNRFLGDTVQINGDVYYYDYTNKQIVVVGPPIAPNPFPSTPTVNAGKATIYGAELGAEWLVTPNDRVSASSAHNHTRVDQVPSVVTGGVLQFGYLLGQPLPNAPLWTNVLAYEHTFRFSSGGSLRAGGDFRFLSSFHDDINYSRADSIQGAYHMSDYHVTYASVGGGWTLGAFVTNAENVAVRSAAFGTTRMLIDPPRIWGVNLTAKF